MNIIPIIALVIGLSVGKIRGQYELRAQFVPYDVEISPAVLLEYRTVQQVERGPRPGPRVDELRRADGAVRLGAYTAGRPDADSPAPQSAPPRSGDPPRRLPITPQHAAPTGLRPPDVSSHQNSTSPTPPPTTNSVTTYRNQEIAHDEVNFNNETPVKGRPLQSDSNGKTTVDIPVNTPVKTPNGTLVTFDDRSSFDGDQCPAGHVRVNGKCVETD